MPTVTSTNLEPKKGSLIVCAGTVTCTSVASMGSGFMVFKKYFVDNIHYKDLAGGWQAALQELLDNYHQRKEEMPPYVRLAKQDNYIGGVATVPYKAGNLGLTIASSSDFKEREKNFKEQYKAAIKGAVLDAKELQRPLFLQPLGIGVYGWNAEDAARMFSEAICEADLKDQVDITIPIFNPQPGSKDELFRETLSVEMAKRGR